VFVCSCFGITEQQVKQHFDSGRCTPRQIASACKAGTDCGSCVKRIQALLGRGAGCTTRDRLDTEGTAVPAPAEAAPAGVPAGTTPLPGTTTVPGTTVLPDAA